MYLFLFHQETLGPFFEKKNFYKYLISVICWFSEATYMKYSLPPDTRTVILTTLRVPLKDALYYFLSYAAAKGGPGRLLQ